MMKRSSGLEDLDIVAEGLAQQDGLAERLARKRAGRDTSSQHVEEKQPIEQHKDVETKVVQPKTTSRAESNAWRKGKAMMQVAISENSHVELSIIAKRRRITLSQLVKESIDNWLEAHGYTLRIEN